VEIRVSPDPLKGTTRAYENEHWELFTADYEKFIAIHIYEPDLFKGRVSENFEIRVWDEDKKSWSDPGNFNSIVLDNGNLWIYYPQPATNNFDAYYSMNGVKAKVQVKYL
jgi:hypothetical protein